MPLISPIARLAGLVLLAALLPMPASAWSAKGHRIVGELAEQQLSETTRAQVRALLADEPSPTLAGISAWPDEVRDEQAWRHTARWHFTNFPRGDCRYSARNQCRDGNCIVAALTAQRQVLADRAAPRQRRIEALKFVVHFVGDIHQPLHAGYADDRGGNDEQVRFNREGANLHSLWDGLLLDTRKLDWQAHARLLSAEPLPSPGPLPARAAERWAEQSCAVLESAAVYPQRRFIDRAYVDRSLPVAEAQIRLASARLAAALEQDLGR